jgi:hypothetical protein
MGTQGIYESHRFISGSFRSSDSGQGGGCYSHWRISKFFILEYHFSYPLQLGKGASGARGDDTKTLKSAVLEWLMPRGRVVIPPLSRNITSDRRFNHEVTSALLCPAGIDWSNTE